MKLILTVETEVEPDEIDNAEPQDVAQDMVGQILKMKSGQYENQLYFHVTEATYED